MIELAHDLSAHSLRANERRWRHVQGVASRATMLSEGVSGDMRERLLAAAWLHDIGYAPSIATTKFHPLDGARYLSSRGDIDWIVISLVAHHTGAEVEAEERSLSDELSAFAKPPGQLLDMLTAADMPTDPDGQPIEPAERVAEILRRYPSDDPVHRAVSRSGPELIATAERVRGRLADVRGRAGGVEAVGDAEPH